MTTRVVAGALIRAELDKLLTLPSLWLTAALTLTSVALFGEPSHSQAGLLVFGALAATHEYQDGRQIQATLLAMPRRTALTAAQMTAVAVTATPVAAAAALITGRLGHTGYLVVTAVLAAAAGTLIRHPAGTVAILLSWYLIGGPVVRARFPATATWLPDVPGSWGPALAWTVAVLIPASAIRTRRDM